MRFRSIHVVRVCAVFAVLSGLAFPHAAEGQKSASSVPRPLPRTLTTATIEDPAFNNILADTMTIPGGWKLDGTIMMAPCTTTPWPVYRAYSPDGLTEMRQMPTLGWRWSATPNPYAPGGCLDLHQPISAEQFLHLYIATLPGATHLVGPLPVPAVFAQWAQGFAQRLNAQAATLYQGGHTTADTAALHIQSHNGSFLIDQRIRAVVVCEVNNNQGPLRGGKCWGRVDALRAPQGALDALIGLVDGNQLPKPQENPQWVQRALARSQQTTNDAAANIFAMQRQAHVTFQAMHDQFMQSSRQSFETFQASHEAKFNNFQNTMAIQRQARDNQASDWVDYALDRQTVTGAGGTVHIDSLYSHTWSNGQNQWFQTNDVNSNPNNVLYGNWTEDTKVHGNGQPY
jgi:hypothetical protein